MATTTTQGSGSKNNNTGRVFLGGTGGTVLSSQSPATPDFKETKSSLGQNLGVNHVVKDSSVTLTSVADASGFCDFTKTSHGYSVGDYIEISGATADSLNTVHLITGVPDANSIVTNVAYAASATAGVAKKMLGTFVAPQTISRWFVQGMYPSTTLAGLSNTALANFGIRGAWSDIHRKVTATRREITAWNMLTNQPTYGANNGDSFSYETTKGSGTVDEASLNNQNDPGAINYHIGDPTPVTGNYPSYT